MKLVVLGASGGVGRVLVQQAAERGHEVRAVGRAGSRMDVPAGVAVHRGDLTSEAFLREPMRGADAVASCLGLKLPGIAPWHKAEDATFLDRSTVAIVAAMKAEGVRRVIAVSAGGVGDSLGLVPTVFRAFLATTALKGVYAALDRMERLYLESGLEVCMVRPPGLTDDAGTGRFVIVPKFPGEARMPRADVAAFMLAELAQPSFSARTPLIGARA
jgi:putative NADH-flavin reductase